jgi:hypothetical protein
MQAQNQTATSAYVEVKLTEYDLSSDEFHFDVKRGPAGDIEKLVLTGDDVYTLCFDKSVKSIVERAIAMLCEDEEYSESGDPTDLVNKSFKINN